MIDFIVNFLALLGIGLIVAGVALVSIPAALVVGGAALCALAYAIGRMHEYRKRAVQK